MLSSINGGRAAAYAQVSQQEQTPAAPSASSDLEAHLNRHHNRYVDSRQSAYAHSLPAARQCSGWSDDFYDGKHGIVAAFDRDGAAAGNWHLRRFGSVAVYWWSLGILYWIFAATIDSDNRQESVMDDIFGVYMWLLGALSLLVAWRGRQAMLSQHVAVTTEGIRIDNGSGTVCTIIPFEHIVEVRVRRLRSCCGCRVAAFDTVTVHRTAAPLERLLCTKTRQTDVTAILRAHDFVNLVTAMKDSQENGTYEGGVQEGGGGGVGGALSFSSPPAARVELQKIQ